jgi:hypothetical protein
MTDGLERLGTVVDEATVLAASFDEVTNSFRLRLAILAPPRTGNARGLSDGRCN